MWWKPHYTSNDIVRNWAFFPNLLTTHCNSESLIFSVGILILVVAIITIIYSCKIETTKIISTLGYAVFWRSLYSIKTLDILEAAFSKIVYTGMLSWIFLTEWKWCSNALCHCGTFKNSRNLFISEFLSDLQIFKHLVHFLSLGNSAL